MQPNQNTVFITGAAIPGGTRQSSLITRKLQWLTTIRPKNDLNLLQTYGFDRWQVAISKAPGIAAFPAVPLQ